MSSFWRQLRTFTCKKLIRRISVNFHPTLKSYSLAWRTLRRPLHVHPASNTTQWKFHANKLISFRFLTISLKRKKWARRVKKCQWNTRLSWINECVFNGARHSRKGRRDATGEEKKTFQNNLKCALLPFRHFVRFNGRWNAWCKRVTLMSNCLLRIFPTEHSNPSIIGLRNVYALQQWNAPHIFHSERKLRRSWAKKRNRKQFAHFHSHKQFVEQNDR